MDKIITRALTRGSLTPSFSRIALTSRPLFHSRSLLEHVPPSRPFSSTLYCPPTVHHSLNNSLSIPRSISSLFSTPRRCFSTQAPHQSEDFALYSQLVHSVENRDLPGVLRIIMKNPTLNISAVGPFNKIPLLLAVKNSDKEMVRTILATSGSDPNVQEPHTANTALHIAVINNIPTDIISLLLAKGSSPNSRNGDGNTPMHLACLSGNLDQVKLLQQTEQCDLHIRNKAGRTPFHLAVISNNQRVQEFLREHYLDLGEDD